MLNSEQLINKVKSYNKFLNPQRLTKAYNFAVKAHENQKRDSDAEADGCILQSERTRPGATSAPGAISLLIVAMQAAIYLIFIVKESALRTPLHNLTWTKGTSLMPA